MKILYLSSWSPYPCLSGGRQRTRQILLALKQVHDVAHISFASGKTERELLQAEGALAVDYQYRAVNKSLPRSLWPFDNPALKELLAEMASDEIHVTVFEQIFSSSHLDQAIGKTVLLEQNIESNLLRQQTARLAPDKKRLGLAQFMALKAYENKTWPRFDLRFAVSDKDAEEMRSRCPGPTLVCSNGVDPKRARKLNLTREPRLLFVGALDYGPNQDAVSFLMTEIMPRVWEQESSLKLRILGRNPNDELREAMDADDRFELFANVSELEPLAQECSISVVPLRMGSGTRLKILEAAAWSMPVITTSLGCEGLSPSLTTHLTIADGAEDFALAVIEAWRNPEKRAVQSEGARTEVLRTYAWSETLRPLLNGLEQLAQ